jgi:hypothetical protein
MLMNRTSLLTFASVATLALAISTAAEAFCPGGHGKFARSFSPVPQHRIISKVVNVKPKDDERSSTSANRKRPVAEPMKLASVANAAKSTGPANAAQSTGATQSTGAANATNTASIANTAASTPVAAATKTTPVAAATKTCLNKEYLDTGAVRFRDTCTNEWAINSTNVDTKASTVNRACLTKENNPNGVVMFRDTCTHEWAMNTADQLALAQVQ